MSYSTSTSSCGFTPLHCAILQNDLAAATDLLNEGCDINVIDKFGYTPLMWAARTGNETLVKLLLNNKASINFTDLQGGSALMHAAMHGNEKIVELLLGGEPKANINETDKEGRTALHYASESKTMSSSKIVNTLLKNGATQVADAFGMLPLHLAVAVNNAAATKMLIDSGAKVNKENVDGHTPLMIAADLGCKEVAKILLDEKADINKKDVNGDTALTLAVKGGNSEVLKLLIDKITPRELLRLLQLGIACNQKEIVKVLLPRFDSHMPLNDATRNSILLMACSQGSTDILELLSSKKLNLNLRASSGETPLILAIINQSPETVEWLINKGIRVDELVNGETPLMWAIYTGNDEIFNLLLKQKNSKPNDRIYGTSPLQIAAGLGQTKMVQFLIDAKVDIDLANKSGMTPLMLAASEGHQDVVNLLLEKGAKIDLVNNQGKSALDLAIGSGHKQLALELITKGANIEKLPIDDLHIMQDWATQVGDQVEPSSPKEDRRKYVLPGN